MEKIMNNLQKALLVISVIILVPSLLCAQSDASPPPSPSPTASQAPAVAADDQVYAPFARRLRVALKEPQIRISWEDVSGIAASYLIYRHTEEISDDNFSNAVLVAEVAKTESFYTDVPADAGSYFYAVLLKDNSGNVYNYLIPYRNKTVSAVVINKALETGGDATELTNLLAQIKLRSIEVSVLSSRNNRTTSIYRSASPILNFNDLQKALVINSGMGGSLSFIDYPVPGIPYYYAAVDSDAAKTGVVTLVPDKNTLKNPVEIPLTTQDSGLVKLPGSRPVRAFPLPDLNQILGESLLPSRTSVTLEPALAKRVQQLSTRFSASIPKTELPLASLLPSDKTLSGSLKGNAATLEEILKTSFTNKKYEDSADKLSKLLAIQIGSELRIKTYFYMAQSKALSGREKEAMLDFLYIRDDLTEYTKPWTDAILKRLQK